MEGDARLLLDLAMVLGVAALTSVLFQRLKLPAVLGYLLAGMIVGPHVPVPLVADLGNVRLMGELGVILLMFAIGLEFSLPKLLRAGPPALLTGTLQVGTQLVVGFLVARLLGWPPLESAFFGASLAIASTMILAKLFEERGLRGPLKETVLGVLLVEDLHAVLLLAALTAAASMGGPSAGAIATTLLKLAVFLAVLVGAGRLVVPRGVRWVADHARDEVLLVVTAGLCFGLAQLAAWAGFSVAMGAFVAGMLVCESGRGRKVEHLVHPLRDLFAAMFFVAVGMLMEPGVVVRDWRLVLLFSALVITVNAVSVTVGATLAGLPLALGVRAGLALGQVGEFGFILLSAGIGLGVVDPSRYALLAAICVTTALTTPALLAAGDPAARLVERHLPKALKTYLSLYQSWAATLRAPALRKAPGAAVRRTFLRLLLDAVLIGLVGALAPRVMRLGAAWLESHGALGHTLAQGAVLLAAALLVALLVSRMLRRSRVLAERLLDLPGSGSLGTRPDTRRAFRTGLRLSALLLTGVPVLAAVLALIPLTSLGALGTAVALAVPLLVWRRARRLQKDLDAGAEWMGEDARDPWGTPEVASAASSGGWRTLRIGPRCPSLGRSLGDLDLPGGSGVTLVALLREGHLLEPRPEVLLQPGDLLALSGSGSALDAAQAVLGREPEAGHSSG
jgi:CPA2 family monovalent cation:H+ antiporter-2